MEKVRIGNDIEVKYTVLRDGQPESFVGATNIAVEVKNEAYGKIIPSTFSIVDNVVNVVLDAKDCVLCGKHRVTLSYNRGNDITIDALAFELVQFTSLTGGTEIVGVELVTVNISGDIGIAIPDNNKVDIDGLNSNIDKLHFKPDTLVALAEVGDVRYSTESKTLEVKVSDTVSIQLGQEMQTRVKNNAGVQIDNGQMVYIDSASGANPLAKIASTTDANIAQRTFGMATENIASNGFGAITTEGLVRDVNTAAFQEGDMLWLGINGAVTNIEPVAPTPKISVGMVLRSNVANGVIYVKIRAIARNQKLSDVYAPTMTGGDVLRWNSTTLRFETFNITNALAGKADLVDGKIPTSQLPSYVDDVLEYANLAAFPSTGETGKIYVALDTNLTYRWSGTAYVEISKSLALGETSATAYRGDRGKTAYDHSQATGNAHGTTASQIPNTPAGTIAATTVQGAINELDGDVAQVRADLNTNIAELDTKIGKTEDTNSFVANVTSGIDYKGYITGGIYQQINVDIPANTDFYIEITTDSFLVSSLYLKKDGQTSYIYANKDIATNIKTLCNYNYPIKGVTLWAKAANVTKNGTFIFKVIIPLAGTGIIGDIRTINTNLNAINESIDGLSMKVEAHDDVLEQYHEYSLTDSLIANTEYKGYLYESKQLLLDIPSDEEFIVNISSSVITDVVLKIKIALTWNDYPTQFAFVPTNTNIVIKIANTISGFCIYVKPGHYATQNGDYTLKVSRKNNQSVANRIEDVEDGKTDGSILHLNPQNEMLTLFQNAKISEEAAGAYGVNTKKCLVLCHFSDIHADSENLGRIKQFCDEYNEFIDEIICTGDMVRDHATSDGVEDDFSWWHENGGENILMSIGNHDTNVVVNGVSSWRGFGKINTYNKYFAPYVANWGVIQPTGASIYGKCYYYKDYLAYKIRIISLDCMYYDNEQNSWFSSILDDAKINGYSVIVLSHGLGKTGENIKCTYSPLTHQAGAVITDTTEYIYNANVHSRIDEFINNGGLFICLLGGHFHMDLFGNVSNTTNTQLFSIVDCAAQVPIRDHAYIKGTRSQDSFNIIAIDTNLKLIKIFKVGYQYDVYMRRKGTLCYNYESKEIVFNG